MDPPCEKDPRITHAWWADNLIMLATGGAQAQAMFDGLTTALRARDLDWKGASLEVMWSGYMTRRQRMRIEGVDESGARRQFKEVRLERPCVRASAIPSGQSLF